MDIHQIEVRYLPDADRLLMQVRTGSSQLFAVWLTRRLMLRLWPPFQRLATQLAVASTVPDALAVPEAREMLVHAAKERTLAKTDFATPFNRDIAERPLGPEPLLAAQVEMQPTAQGGIKLGIKEHRGRQVQLTLTATLATALMQLIEKALAASEWGVVSAPEGAVSTEASALYS